MAKVGASWGAANAAGGAATCSLPAHTIAANDYVTIFIGQKLAAGPPTIASVTDGSNALALVTGSALTNGVMRGEFWAGHIATGGSTTFVVSTTGAVVSGIVALATEWGGTTETLDVAAANNGASLAAMTVTSPATVTGACFVIGGFVHTTVVTFSSEKFSPAGTSIAVPDLLKSQTGISNLTGEISETLSGSAGNAQTYSATASAAQPYVGCLICLRPISPATCFIGAQGIGGGNAG